MEFVKFKNSTDLSEQENRKRAKEFSRLSVGVVVLTSALGAIVFFNEFVALIFARAAWPFISEIVVGLLGVLTGVLASRTRR